MQQEKCPFKVGDFVKFMPSKRTKKLYQDVGRFGVVVGEIYQIEQIKDGLYLYIGPEKGGWPWNEFALEDG